MSQPFIGEIRMFGGNFAPAGWAFCDGQSLPIAENDSLFTLIGTTYGGDGEETFNLPNLQGRLPIHQGGGHQVGQGAGVTAVTLTIAQTPAHGHPLVGSTATASGTNPQGGVFAHLPDAGVQTAYGATASGTNPQGG